MSIKPSKFESSREYFKILNVFPHVNLWDEDTNKNGRQSDVSKSNKFQLFF